jgi:hypothetical protein
MGRLVLIFTVCVVAAYAAEPSCPWLNAATAGGVLEGPVHVTVTKNGEDATCEFARQNSPEKLRIEVVTKGAARGELAAYKAQCSAPVTPLRSIGTDAVACRIETGDREAAEQVVGRVREQAFLVRVSAGVVFSRDTLREKSIRVAEQVAGNLF